MDDLQINRKINLSELKKLQSESGKSKLKHYDLGLYIPANIHKSNIIKSNDMKKVIKINIDGVSAIVKFEEDIKNYKDILHEGFIGVFGINKLNTQNFSKTLDVSLNKDCIVINGNKIGDKCSYVITERIDGIELHKYMKTYPDDLKKILLTVFDNLLSAYNLIEFTHYDLHPGNIIIDKDEHPVIIDFGYSHIKYGGKHYGVQHSKYNIYPKANWAYDVFKLLAHILYELTDNIKLEEGLITSHDKKFDLELKLTKISRELRQVYSKLNGSNDQMYLDYIKTLEADFDQTEDIIKIYDDHIRDSTTFKPLRLSPLSLKIKNLCKFFDPRFEDIRYFALYHLDNPYFELDEEMCARNYDFEKFVDLAYSVLT